MTVAFAATLVEGPVVCGPKRKRIKFKIQMPESWTGTGVALDMSDYLDVVCEYQFGPSTAVVDFGWVYDIVGTAASDDDGITGSTATLCAHSSAGSAATMANSDTDDMKATTNMYLTCWGY